MVIMNLTMHFQMGKWRFSVWVTWIVRCESDLFDLLQTAVEHIYNFQDSSVRCMKVTCGHNRKISKWQNGDFLFG